ncbi:dihydropteroate synthase, partial [Salmonella enterica subsp. enterica serovar Typhimurium]
DAGVEPEQIILDPGIGFAKTHEQNWELIRNLGRFTELEHDGVPHRMLFGASRKGFLNTLLTDAEGSPRPAEERDTATAVLSGQAA